MELYFLGTGAGLPSRMRNVTSLIFHVDQIPGAVWMFDCGEGTQQQMLASPYAPGKIHQLFVTHLHGDHVYGIPGLLGSRSFSGVESPFCVFGPPGIREYIETTLRLSRTHLVYPLRIEEIQEGVVYEDERFQVSCRLLKHGIDSYGYRIKEKPRAGILDVQRLMDKGIPAGPIYGLLKKGQDVVWTDGQVLRSQDFTGPPIPGRIVVICGDTQPTDATVALAWKADVLVHEATYDASLADRAALHHHSTGKQAGDIAKTAAVKRLVLTHLSARYDEQAALALERETAAVFPHVQVAYDHTRISIR